MDTKKLDSIKATIAKLITLANDKGATKGEAETAMERATALMTKYQLDQAEVLSQKIEKSETLDVLQEEADCYYFEQSFNWEYSLGWSIGNIFDCKAIRSRNGFAATNDKFFPAYKMIFIGMPDDIALVLYFFDYCQNEIGRETELFTKLKRKGNDFALGMTTRVIERLTEMYKKAAEQTQETCKALIVVKKDAIDKHVAKEFPHLRKDKATKIKDTSAYMQGVAAGNRVSLSSNRRQVG